MPFVCNSIEYPAPVAAEDNQSLTRCFNLPVIRDCGTIPEPWQPCGLDICYLQPILEGDVIRLQYQLPDTLNDFDTPAPTHGWKITPATVNWLIGIEATDINGNVLAIPFVDFALKYYVAGDGEGNRWQGIEIDSSVLPRCFAFKITLNTVSGEEVFYSNPYEKVICANTILIEGLYPNGDSDCSGNLYLADTSVSTEGITVLGTYFTYSNQRRVRGQFYLNAMNVTSVNLPTGISAKKTSFSRYKLSTERIPDYVALDIMNSLKAQYVLIDGDSYRFESTIERNLDTGTMWIIDTEVLGYECSQKFNCF